MFGFSQRPGGERAGGPPGRPQLNEDSFDYRMYQIGMYLKRAAMKSRMGAKRGLGRRQLQLFVAQSRVLSLLNERSPMGQQELVDVLGAPPQALAEVLNAMAGSGLITSAPNPADAADQLVSLTEAGAEQAKEQAEENARLDPTAALTDEERQQLFGLLDKIIAHLDAQDDGEDADTVSGRGPFRRGRRH